MTVPVQFSLEEQKIILSGYSLIISTLHSKFYHDKDLTDQQKHLLTQQIAIYERDRQNFRESQGM